MLFLIYMTMWLLALDDVAVLFLADFCCILDFIEDRVHLENCNPHLKVLAITWQADYHQKKVCIS